MPPSTRQTTWNWIPGVARVGRTLSVLWPFRRTGLYCQRCRTMFHGKGGAFRVVPYVTLVQPLLWAQPVAIPALCGRCRFESTAPERLDAYRAYWLEASGGDPAENARVWAEIELAVSVGAA